VTRLNVLLSRNEVRKPLFGGGGISEDLRFTESRITRRNPPDHWHLFGQGAGLIKFEGLHREPLGDGEAYLVSITTNSGAVGPVRRAASGRKVVVRLGWLGQ
jgi:hypothetical protein